MEMHEPTDRNVRYSAQRWTCVGVVLLAVFVGAIVGHLLGGDRLVQAAVQSDATPTELTESEREELNRLRTAVAEATACVDGTPTSEPNPDASPEAVELLSPGTTVTTENGWTVTVQGIGLPAAEDRVKAEGRFLQVEMTVTNNNDSSEIFGFEDWVLVDEQGNTYKLQHTATTLVSGSKYYRKLNPGDELTFHIIYDVPVDSGSSFTLVDTAQPTIQYALTLQMFG
jgi:Domain of unknown function (DUF4352)